MSHAAETLHCYVLRRRRGRTHGAQPQRNRAFLVSESLRLSDARWALRSADHRRPSSSNSSSLRLRYSAAMTGPMSSFSIDHAARLPVRAG